MHTVNHMMLRLMLVLKLLSLLSSVLMTTSLVAQSPAARGLIDGSVRAAGTQAPVANARIQIIGAAVQVVSSDDGRFRLSAPVGVVRIAIRALGYAPLTRTDRTGDRDAAAGGAVERECDPAGVLRARA
jgi:hypothetical protein